MVDNFDLIRPFLRFENQGDFYFLQILQRKKDGCNVQNGQNNSKRAVKDYFVNSLERFDLLKDEVIDLCNTTGARAYIRLNKRNYRTVSLAFAEEMLSKLRINQEFRDPRIELASIAGRFHDAGKEGRTWIVDIDDTTMDSDRVKLVVEVIDCLCEPYGDFVKVLERIPTKSGVHLVTRPFNADKFNKYIQDMLGDGEIAILKDNPTVLYCP